MRTVRILVCGDRKWTDRMAIWNRLASMKSNHPHAVVIEGGAKGADTIAWEVASQLGLKAETFQADWEHYGRKAGPIRNRQMLDTKPDLVLAFHADLERSRGTKDCVTEARRRGIPVEVITGQP